ncbi:ABC transporter substrate-binding protein [Winogradskyella immobilis]|uniref:ABC transporter substrate-binding protein n=1 Tax=Winogradskyella immobilis TaxID=2816852 RepID=A0ABS8EPI3_9FLAO|nr:helical backbone metal receptor [Winogradskyella immobilis]MCC1484475.1 ABC transporter substrate-binding protein [Winogradskyella immobilis]MCG0016567.1 helical backbone metal receptor [Winogradskyella immobilis]
MVFKDQLNRTINLVNTPKRIVSLVPSQTELLVDLGLESNILGITKFCVHPSHLLKSKTIVGGTKQVHVEKVKALNPDIILCNKEENSLEILQQMEQIAPVHMSDIYTLDDGLDLIKVYGEIFDCKNNATDIVSQIKIQLESFKTYIANKPELKVAYFIWKTPWMVAAKHTFINHLLEINKFKNVYGHLERYPEIDINIMSSQIKPDLVLLSSEPFPFKEKHKEELELLSSNLKVVLVDGEYFSWYGSRLIEAFNYFKTLRLNLY